MEKNSWRRLPANVPVRLSRTRFDRLDKYRCSSQSYRRSPYRLVGKYIQPHDAYISVVALKHGGIGNRAVVDIKWVDSELGYRRKCKRNFEGIDGILVPGGFGDRGIDGKIIAIKYAREKQNPIPGSVSWYAVIYR